MPNVLRPLVRASPTCIRSLRRCYAPWKDSQDRTSLKPHQAEGTASGTDDDVSAQRDASFDPTLTRPEAERDRARVGNEGNPLEASGANQELSKPTEAGHGSQPAGQGPKSRAASSPKRGRPRRSTRE